MPGTSASPKGALLLRSLALFIILYQFRLLARDLADTPVFAFTLGFGFAAAWFLARRGLPPLPALASLLLIPWVLRGCFALGARFLPGPVAAADALLLNFDRNNFVSLLPFYWGALSTYFSARSRNFLRGDIIASDFLLLGIFSAARTGELEAYRWPALIIALFTALFFLQILALMLSVPREYRLGKGERFSAGLALLSLVCLGGVLFIQPSQEGAVSRGGGLLEPNLFRFDFTQYLKLESEISMKEDLVLITKQEPGNLQPLLRRFVLSGYDPARGFFRNEELDEKTHPQRLPERPVTLEGEGEEAAPYQAAEQEYFLVNLEPSVFIGLNRPVLITPFEQWDASSFSAAYGVRSFISQALPFELIDAVGGPPSPEALGLGAGEYASYTEYGGDEDIARYARTITAGLDNYWEKVQAVFERLKYGEYRYSLKPGIASGGDQLKYFLFQSKKGYCSYYAFSMALLLRSLGIPARVAVGFFIAPDAYAFDYYPVRSDMAHAWVEVYFPRFGWIEYDPTTDSLAEGEEFRVSSGVPQDVFDRLMKEILDNHSRLSPREGAEAGDLGFLSLGRQTVRFFRERWPALLLGALGLGFLFCRAGLWWAACLPGLPRKRAARLWAHVLRRLSLGGFRRRPSQGEAGWARALDQRLDLYPLCQGIAAARYAPDFGPGDLALLMERYRRFREGYGRAVPRRRRILAWILPPLALALGPSGRLPPGPPAARIACVLLLASLGGDGNWAQAPETGTGADAGASALFNDAFDFQRAEHWERAVELYSRGSREYPRDPRFPLALGELYSGHRLFTLAWEEYRKAGELLPDNGEILFLLSRTAGYLNRDEASAEYLERLLDLDPRRRDAIGSLGWMYYKLHRLEEGERLLKAALDRYGEDADFSMTLGTIYLDMFRYEESRRWYLRAIAGGEASGDRSFTSVAYYNLSILESRFYHYDAAFERTASSLEAQNRPSARIARGELFLRRMDLSRVFAEYEEAREIDPSPLAKVNLAQAFQIGGRLEEARLYAEDCLKAGDLSWMLNYGIDPLRYRRDLHEILANTYRGLANAEGAAVYGSPGERFRGLFRRIAYRFKGAVHRQLYRKYSLRCAEAYPPLPGGARLNALIQYYHAFEAYPARARLYLARARDFELALIPQAEGSYDLEEGTLMKDRELLRRALAGFHPLWERDLISNAYTELALLLRGGERREAAERLYALNRGALRQRGIALPATLSIDLRGTPRRAAAEFERALRKALHKAGIEDPADANRSGEKAPARYRLRITVDREAEGVARCELYDSGRGIGLLRRDIPLGSPSPGDIGAFVRELGDELFTQR
jgi:Tfp pilus assembly protein PilF